MDELPHNGRKPSFIDQDDTMRFDLTHIQPHAGRYEPDAEDLSLILNLNQIQDTKQTDNNSEKKWKLDNMLEEKTKDEKPSEISIQKRRKKELGLSKEEEDLPRNRPNSLMTKRTKMVEHSSENSSKHIKRQTDQTPRQPMPVEITPFPFCGVGRTIGNRANRLKYNRGLYTARPESSKPVYFNVLCIGKSRTGKSSFLEQLILRIFGKTKIVDRQEQKIIEYVSEKKGENGRFVLNCIDTKGYSDEYPADIWYSNIEKLINGKNESYHELKTISESNKDLRDRHLVDSRVHLCLYFVDSSSRLNVQDVLHLKKLKKLVNIIPVMVGSDPEVDSEEIEVYKDRLNKDARDYEIEWLNLKHEVLHLQQILTENRISPIDPCPPFWFQEIAEEDTDPAVFEDFNLLAVLLAGPISHPLIERTDVIYQLNQDRLDKQKKLQEEQNMAKGLNLGVGIALGMGALGFIMAVKNKIF